MILGITKGGNVTILEEVLDEFLRCGWLEYGFLRVVCSDCIQEHLVIKQCVLECALPIEDTYTFYRPKTARCANE